MRDLAVYPDPVIVTLDALRNGGFLSDPVVAQGEVKISRSLPARDSTTSRADLVVSDDGEAYEGSSEITEAALVRVSVWDNNAFRATEVARYARAYLLAYLGDARVVDFRRGTRPLPTTDPDDGSPLTSFTIIARLKAE